MATIFEEFATVLSAAAGNACRCKRSEVAQMIFDITGIASLWAHEALGEDWPDLTDGLNERGISIKQHGTPEDVRDRPWGITTARAAIAETGSVILQENRLNDRAVSLMTNKLIVLCPLAHLYSSLDDAATILREISRDGNSYATLVSGPSRTADIERQLTIGVQGPGELHVILVTE